MPSDDYPEKPGEYSREQDGTRSPGFESNQDAPPGYRARDRGGRQRGSSKGTGTGGHGCGGTERRPTGNSVDGRNRGRNGHGDGGYRGQQRRNDHPHPSPQEPGRQSSHQGATDLPFPVGRGLTDGLKLIGFGLAGFGVLALLSGINYLMTETGAMYGGPLLQTMGLALTAMGVAHLIAGYGLLSVEPWGWQAGVGALAFGAVASLFAFGSGGIASLLTQAGVCWYLYQQESQYSRLADGTDASPHDSLPGRTEPPETGGGPQR